MQIGKWLQPRYPNKGIFEKDYPQIDIKALSVKCPGCSGEIKLLRKAANGRIGGWCGKCDRGVVSS
ncbi:MAG: hypothetical protein AUJ52_03990 [Elusimicrobia bacterium CG1_02_63_36]|nr:MAG: hypothetical protein AUJ52_03990 [Elusimicrobia bacterium CG1_02_63_36]PIP83261.1 MAG: hypothetical protein COR54_10450 [Elusimicrobia bacterium CG22_combo_CG10-13_8_21_14_all_63_91]PJA14917.1 MAG: hypothetical protein COX66_11270 [Elusimicrobia bacterium CG_4_10_14_0_2_um_filter_63_34]PJB25999.1 MAG: hypothetical protein CO113_05785 [Elusimicrobia bacterium CG_4_9_14_3_um_filter_62_55]